MYVKNVSQLLKTNAPQSNKLFEGSTITGKILTNENGKGTIKLYDGTIIPAIFISENDLEQEKQLKFIVQDFDGENFVLRIAGRQDDSKSLKSFFSIVRDLNIPFEEGKGIILDLLRFNLPATNENINQIFKNLEFLRNIQNMSDEDIINFLKQALGAEINTTSKEFLLAKELLQNMKTIDRSFLTFMLENEIPQNVESMVKAQKFMSDKFFFNSFIDNIRNIMAGASDEDEAALHKYMKLLNENSDIFTKPAATATTDSKATLIKTNHAPMPLTAMETLLTNSVADKLTKEFPVGKAVAAEALSQGLELVRSSISNTGNNATIFMKKLLDEYDIAKNPLNFQREALPEAGKLLLDTLQHKLAATHGSIDKNMILTSFEEVFNQLNEMQGYLDAATGSGIHPIWTSLNFEKGITNTVLTNSELQLMNDLIEKLSQKLKNDNAPAEFREALCIIKDNKDIFSFGTSKVYNAFLDEFDTTKNPANFVNNKTSKVEELFLNALKNNMTSKDGNIDKDTVVKSFKQALAVYNDSIDIDSLSTADLTKKLAQSENLLKLSKTVMGGNPSNTEKLLIDALLKNITRNSSGPERNITVASFEEALNVFKENKDIFSLGASDMYRKLADNFEMFRQISPNYSLYFFNLYEGSNMFRNNIIIKNKCKGSKHIDINDVKAFITVDTKNLGAIEGNLYKKNNDISIYFSVPEEHVGLFKNNLKVLKNTLKDYGYHFINLSVEAKKEDKILPFLDFFNESIIKELDVKV